MKNYIQPGENMTLTAPYDVLSGGGLLVGKIFGVASDAALNGTEVVAALTGIFELAKADSQAWTVGALIYWDNTNKVCTTTASGNSLIGVAAAAVASTAGLVKGLVRLNGISVP